jgi:hypothetical protein
MLKELSYRICAVTLLCMGTWCSNFVRQIRANFCLVASTQPVLSVVFYILLFVIYSYVLYFMIISWSWGSITDPKKWLVYCQPDCILISSEDSEFSSFLSCLDCLWGPQRLLSNVCWDKTAGTWNLVPEMHGAILHSPIHLHVILLRHTHFLSLSHSLSLSLSLSLYFIFTWRDTLVIKLVQQNKKHMQGNVC